MTLFRDIFSDLLGGFIVITLLYLIVMIWTVNVTYVSKPTPHYYQVNYAIQTN